MRFDQYEISDEIKKGLEDKGLRRPTDIQFRAIPSILKGQDVMAVAQTGTGKTAAFAIPALHRLQTRSSRPGPGQVACLVMVPTRELAIQIAGVFKDLGRYTRLSILGLVGGVDQDPQIQQLKKGVDVLVATPGRMFDLINQKVIDLSRTGLLILDEADQMLGKGFIHDIRGVLPHLPSRHQTLFFSATLNKEIKELAYSVVRNPIRIQVSPVDKVSRNIHHQVCYVEMEDKRFFLERIFHGNPQSKILVFARTKVRVERIAQAMKRVEISAQIMHGGKDQKERSRILEAFREGKPRMLITTDLNARGIDIPEVQMVVNYDLPEDPENYVHRVGRSGRGKNKGYAISFCSPEEKPLLESITQYLGKPIMEWEIDPGEYAQVVALSQEDPDSNWQRLIDEQEQSEKKKKRKKRN